MKINIFSQELVDGNRVQFPQEMKTNSSRERNNCWSIWGTNISKDHDAIDLPVIAASASNVLLQNGVLLHFFKHFLRF